MKAANPFDTPQAKIDGGDDESQRRLHMAAEARVFALSWAFRLGAVALVIAWIPGLIIAIGALSWIPGVLLFLAGQRLARGIGGRIPASCVLVPTLIGLIVAGRTTRHPENAQIALLMACAVLVALAALWLPSTGQVLTREHRELRARTPHLNHLRAWHIVTTVIWVVSAIAFAFPGTCAIFTPSLNFH